MKIDHLMISQACICGGWLEALLVFSGIPAVYTMWARWRAARAAKKCAHGCSHG